jgi:DNA-damage-inducible protein J
MGLSVSDAIRLLMIRVAEEHQLPFSVTVPNPMTRKAIDELEAGKGQSASIIDALMNEFIRTLKR